MAWVRSEYAGALAVVCTWATALMPWSVSYLGAAGITQVVIRFHWLLLRFQFGAPDELFLPSRTVLSAVQEATNPGTREAATIWIGTTVVVTLLVAFSVLYYLREERVEAMPVDPVRLIGGVLLVVAVAHAFALGLLIEHRAGQTLPVGTLFEFVFAGLLLTVDRDPAP